MAERSNATANKTQDAALDVSTLQKRGRRRLVGAIALVLLAVIVLPMVFDPEPKPNAPLVSVRIPSEEGSKFTPKVAPTSAPRTEAAEHKPSASAAPVAIPVPAVPAAPAPEVQAPAVQAPPIEQLIFQVGAFASPDKVKEISDQLKQAKLPYYTESLATAKGSVTRIRLGPFTSPEVADKARERAMALGLNPAPVATK